MPKRIVRATIPIGIQPGTKLLRIERALRTRAWHVWLNANYDFTLGTYLALYDDGRIDRVTINPDFTEDVFSVKSDRDGDAR